MATVTALEAKTRLGELIERAEKGEEIVITRYQKPVVRMIAVDRPDLDQARRAFEALDRHKADMRRRGVKPITVEQILSARNEGRK